MKFLFAALATLLFSCSSAFGQNTYNNYYQNNFRPNYYQSHWNRTNGRYNARVFVYNYRPNYYTYNRNNYTGRRTMYNSYYNQNYSAFSGFLMNFYYNNR